MRGRTRSWSPHFPPIPCLPLLSGFRPHARHADISRSLPLLPVPRAKDQAGSLRPGSMEKGGQGPRQGDRTCAFGQAHTVDLLRGQRVWEQQSQSAVGKVRNCVTHWAGTRHCPETRPGPMRALTGRSGPLIPLSKASSQGRSCAWGCHILRSGPPPAGAPWLPEDTMEGGEEGAVLTLQGPRPEPRTPSPSPQARATWPLVQAFLRRLSANWHQDRKGSRQAGLLHPGCPLLTGARHGQPHQPVLAAALGSGGSVLAQVRVSMRHASSPARPQDVPEHLPLPSLSPQNCGV